MNFTFQILILNEKTGLQSEIKLIRKHSEFHLGLELELRLRL